MGNNELGFYLFDLPVPKESKWRRKGYGNTGLPPGINTGQQDPMKVLDMGIRMVYNPYKSRPCIYGEECGYNCFFCQQPVEICDSKGGGKL